MIRKIVDEYERLGLDDLEDIDLLKEMGLTNAAYPEYDEDIIEAVMNMLDIPLEKALKIWDNDNTRFDYYEYIAFSCDRDNFVELAEYRIDELEEFETGDGYDGFTDEIVKLKTLHETDLDRLRAYLIDNGWMIYDNVAIGWDMDELNEALEGLE